MEVKIVRLLSGEDLVAKVDTSKKDVMTLFSPIIIVANQQGDASGRMNFGFMPWPFFAERSDVEKNGVPVLRSAIVMTYNPLPDILNQYNSATGGIITSTNGLVTPRKSPLILG